MSKVASALVAAIAAVTWAGATIAQPYRAFPDRTTYDWRDLTRELQNKMTGTYTVSSAGDFLWQLPVVKRMSPQLREVMQKADTTVGNLEGQIIDERNCYGSCGYGNNWMPKDTAKALAELGVDFIAPGEFDGGVRGHMSSAKLLDEVGIKMTGAGPNLTIARQPVFQELPQGRVAMLTACPGQGCGDPAQDRLPAGRVGGEVAGVNAIRMNVWNTVTAPQLEQLRAIRDSFVARRHETDVAEPTELPKDSPGRLVMTSTGFPTTATRFIVGDAPGELHYELHPQDEQAQILAVRNAKELADFVMFTMHVHQNRYTFQAYSQDHYPPNYLRPFIHKLIDNGLDMYVGHGNHSIQGIEIYKGRPIFYNHGNLGVSRYGADDSPPNPGNMTNVEEGELDEDWVQRKANLEAYIANTKYVDGRLREIRIYPVDLGLDKTKRPWSRMSVPMTPSPEVANRILEDIQRYSAPFGTKISIENGVGVIRLPPEATVAVGGDIVIPGRGPKSQDLPGMGTRPGGGGAWVWSPYASKLPDRALPQIKPK